MRIRSSGGDMTLACMNKGLLKKHKLKKKEHNRQK